MASATNYSQSCSPKALRFGSPLIFRSEHCSEDNLKHRFLFYQSCCQHMTLTSPTFHLIFLKFWGDCSPSFWKETPMTKNQLHVFWPIPSTSCRKNPRTQCFTQWKVLQTFSSFSNRPWRNNGLELCLHLMRTWKTRPKEHEAGSLIHKPDCGFICFSIYKIRFWSVRGYLECNRSMSKEQASFSCVPKAPRLKSHWI